MKKNRFNTYLDEDLSKKMTAAMELCDAGSESEFIRNAVEFYIGYIFSEKSSDYLSPTITDTVKEIQYSYEQRVSEMLFKTAVELSKINHVLVDSLKIPRNYLEGLTAQTAREVAENNGIIHLEQYVNGGDHHAEADH